VRATSKSRMMSDGFYRRTTYRLVGGCLSARTAQNNAPVGLPRSRSPKSRCWIGCVGWGGRSPGDPVFSWSPRAAFADELSRVSCSPTEIAPAAVAAYRGPYSERPIARCTASCTSLGLSFRVLRDRCLGDGVVGDAGRSRAGGKPSNLGTSPAGCVNLSTRVAWR
jgi:hypothetical protein